MRKSVNIIRLGISTIIAWAAFGASSAPKILQKVTYMFTCCAFTKQNQS